MPASDIHISSKKLPVTLIFCGNRKLQTLDTVLISRPDSLFAQMLQCALESEDPESRQSIVLDCGERNYVLVRLLINALRHPASKIIPPDDFKAWSQLEAEALYWNVPDLVAQIQQQGPTSNASTITVSYHGTLAFGKQGFSADVNFRKIHRILIQGMISDCKAIFGETLNQGRDGTMGEDRYTSRVFLKHVFLEQAFDALAANGYAMLAATSHSPAHLLTSHKDEQEAYMHYSQFVFQKI